MLVLTRRLDEKIVIPGLDVTIQVLDVRHGRVRLGISAPGSVRIVRQEVLDTTRRADLEAAEIAESEELVPA